ncbi:hypothetical protein C8Q75DRAFT_733325 [Abortiporus biennis]|nr:hypothetical protein C8Q75DRAFT_733325 [Abortiporus biennis]
MSSSSRHQFSNKKCMHHNAPLKSKLNTFVWPGKTSDGRPRRGTYAMEANEMTVLNTKLNEEMQSQEQSSVERNERLKELRKQKDERNFELYSLQRGLYRTLLDAVELGDREVVLHCLHELKMGEIPQEPAKWKSFIGAVHEELRFLTICINELQALRNQGVINVAALYYLLTFFLVDTTTFKGPPID